jgi:hypothetical protein
MVLIGTGLDLVENGRIGTDSEILMSENKMRNIENEADRKLGLFVIIGKRTTEIELVFGMKRGISTDTITNHNFKQVSLHVL